MDGEMHYVMLHKARYQLNSEAMREIFWNLAARFAQYGISLQVELHSKDA